MGERMTRPERVEVMGVPVDPLTMSQTVEVAGELVDSGSFAHFVGVNADKVLQMLDDPEMDAMVRSCEIINADGASMLLAARRLGVFIPERVAGIDLMLELCKLAQQKGYRIGLVGAKEEVVEKTKEASVVCVTRG